MPSWIDRCDLLSHRVGARRWRRRVFSHGDLFLEGPILQDLADRGVERRHDRRRCIARRHEPGPGRYGEVLRRARAIGRGLGCGDQFLLSSLVSIGFLARPVAVFQAFANLLSAQVLLPSVYVPNTEAVPARCAALTRRILDPLCGYRTPMRGLPKASRIVQHCVLSHPTGDPKSRRRCSSTNPSCWRQA